MTSKTRAAASAVGLALVLGFIYYVFTAPYTRFPGVRIGGQFLQSQLLRIFSKSRAP